MKLSIIPLPSGKDTTRGILNQHPTASGRRSSPYFGRLWVTAHRVNDAWRAAYGRRRMLGQDIRVKRPKRGRVDGGHPHAAACVAGGCFQPRCGAAPEEWMPGSMPEVMFAGPDGRLEGRYHHAKKPNAPVALLLHPHPLHGGTMNNRVVHGLYGRFQAMGFSVLRFNFRGVGKSQGRYDGGIGEISDAASALDFLQTINPAASMLWVAGYSFGSYVGMQLLMRRPEMGGFVSISAPASHYDFGFLAPCPCSGMILHGEDDELVPVASVGRLVDKLNTQKGVKIDYRTLPGAGHVFTPPQVETVVDMAEDHVLSVLNRSRSALAAD